MTNPVGPVFAGGRFEEYVVAENNQQYTILFLPDLNNDALQKEGKPPYFYYLPEQVRIARMGDTGDYKFHLLHFVGTFSEDTHVGLGNAEVVGGVFSVTTTSRYPTSVLQKALAQVQAKWQGKDNKYWGIRGRAKPQIAVVPILSNETAITNLSPDASGNPPGGGGRGALPPAGGGGPALPPGPGGEAPRNALGVRMVEPPARVRHGDAFQARSSLDAWAWKLQGAGAGSITGGENAYSGLIGAYPSEILWAGFHGAYSPIVVTQNLRLAVWSELIDLTITGNWDRVFQHFSAHAKASGWWWSADIKAEFNNLRMSGGIDVKLSIDGTTPSGQKLEEEMNKRIDLIYGKFMEAAQKVIFEPQPPNVEPAKAEGGGGFFGWGGGFALKYRRDSTKLNLYYHEARNQRYIQPHTISSSLQGFYNEIKQDPQAEKKYFTRLVLGDLSRKVTRIVSPQINWTGDPVGAVSCQVGYPGARGEIQWTGHLFQNSDTWSPVMAERKLDEVANPPSGWSPDKTFVKRSIHFKEPPRESDSPYVHIFVEQPDVPLDPQPNGELTNDHDIIVRLEDAGLLDVGPIGLNIALLDNTQQVDIEFKALGRTSAGQERPVTRFTWKFDDQDTPRIWKRFTGQPGYIPAFQYRVTCIVKGSFFSKGMTWSGPWVDANGNGPITINVPGPDDEGVTKRNLTLRELLEETPRIVPEESGLGGGPTPPPPAEPTTGGAPPPPAGIGTPPTGIGAPPRLDQPVYAESEGYNLLPPPPVGTAISAPVTEYRMPNGISHNGHGKEEPAEELAVEGGWRVG